MCFRRWSIGMKLVVLISHLLHRYQFLNQFLRGINFHWLVIFQLVVMQPWSTTVFWRYKPVSKRYQKFKEVKWMRITETILFHDHGAWICSMFCFFGCVFFFFLVCDPKLILQISGTFQETCRKLHRKTEEADNAVKELLSKLSDCCDELGKMDLDDSTIETHVQWYGCINVSCWATAYQSDIFGISHGMICCCCILVLVALRLAHSSWSCRTFLTG